jgi:hypothetical protein
MVKSPNKVDLRLRLAIIARLPGEKSIGARK